jgi:hypothetical protein
MLLHALWSLDATDTQVDEIMLADDDAIKRAMKFVWERTSPVSITSRADAQRCI